MISSSAGWHLIDFTFMPLPVAGRSRSGGICRGTWWRSAAIPLWGTTSPAPSSVRESRALHGTFEQLATSMIYAGGGWAFLDALHQLYQLSREVPLAGALRSHQSLDVLLDVMRAAETPDRPIGMDPEPATLEEAVTALDLIEHQLRPLFAPAAEADLCHATANGLAALTGMAARWARGTPFVMSEHGIYLRERYLSYTARRLTATMSGISCCTSSGG